MQLAPGAGRTSVPRAGPAHNARTVTRQRRDRGGASCQGSADSGGGRNMRPCELLFGGASVATGWFGGGCRVRAGMPTRRGARCVSLREGPAAEPTGATPTASRPARMRRLARPGALLSRRWPRSTVTVSGAW